VAGEELFGFDHAPQGLGQLQQADGVGDGDAILAGLLADLIVAEAELARHAVEGQCQFDGVQVFALDVLDDGELKHLLVVGVSGNDRDFGQSGLLRGAPAAFAGDDLVFIRRGAAHDDGLDDAFALDRESELHHGIGFEFTPGLVGVGVDVVDGDEQDAAVTRRSLYVMGGHGGRSGAAGRQERMQALTERFARIVFAHG